MDFTQSGSTTIHALTERFDSTARNLVQSHASRMRVALLLPMLYEELRTEAPRRIRSELSSLPYLSEIVVSLTARSQEEVEKVQRFFRPLGSKVRILWCEGEEVRNVVRRLHLRGYDVRGLSGKGYAVWLGLGAVLEDHDVVVLHDADVETYHSGIVDRLLLPIVVPELDFYFSKGYYARITSDQIYGRVTRLFLWPLLDALEGVLAGPSPFLRYLKGFRYPLAGEMAMTTELARNVRIPTDWGLELGILGEVYPNASSRRIAQVDLGIYSHKHSALGEKGGGLRKMARDDAVMVYRHLAASEGAVFDRDTLTTLTVAYRKEAQAAIRKYHADALANGLVYDRHAEELFVEAMEPILREAGERFFLEPSRGVLAEWRRVLSADSEAPHLLKETLRRSGR